MDDVQYLLAVTLLAAAVTWGLRALPFALLAPLRSSRLLPYLAERIPVGVMVILTVYTLRHVDLIDASSVTPAFIGVLVTIALHLWKANMLLSIAGGTAGYALLVSTLFSAH
ncbi:branched-chain amino acid transporter permease [Brevibacterium album]|uniref:branched-chain amino acid transporter permease n=1 Tax=Brevibacterium album TaxID=417948 RepID=UPI0004262F92|nr:AzlD domain-containing protein [Brevibacterium album]